LAGPVTGPVRRFQGGPVQGGRLLPVTAGTQEVAHCRGDLYGVQMPTGDGREVRGGMQVGPFGFQPGRRMAERRQVGDTGRRAARGRLAVGGGHQQDVPPGGERGMKVVVEKPPHRGVCVVRVVGGDQGPGVLTEQVMQEVATARRLGEQVMVIQFIEQPPCGAQISGDQRGGSVAVDGGPWDQAESAKQLLLVRAQVPVGQAERGRDRHVLGAHEG
jgi:hypothetical protein